MCTRNPKQTGHDKVVESGAHAKILESLFLTYIHKEKNGKISVVALVSIWWIWISTGDNKIEFRILHFAILNNASCYFRRASLKKFFYKIKIFTW